MAKRGEQVGDKTVVLEQRMLKSTAFLSLTGRSIPVLMLFMTKRQMEQDNSRRQRWNVANNGRITFTYVEAEESWQIPRATFMRALKSLEARGFIDVTFRGTGTKGSANRYALSQRWRKWGTSSFEEAPTLVKHNNRGFKKGHRYHPASERGTMVDL